MPEAARGPRRRPGGWPRRRPGFWLLAAAVALAHLLLGNRLAEDRVGWGAGEAPPPRIEVAFVRELAAAKPPPMAAPVAAPERRLAAVAAQARAAAASAPAAAASAAVAEPPAPVLAQVPPAPAPEPGPAPMPEPMPEPLPQLAAATELAPPTARPASEPLPALAAPTDASAANATTATAAATAATAATAVTAMPAPTASAAAATAASGVPSVAFAWPPSTRLSYKLLGDYRGPVEGTAQVDWLRQGTRYQVHLSTAIGPVLSRHITSEGELTAKGLAPRRFDGEQKVLFRSPRRWQLRFGPEQVLLSDGKEVPTQPGVQDEASQFVQLTWLFTTQPGRLRVGGAVEMPLAISRKLERWTYDVVGEDLLRFAFGEVPTFHLKPRRAASGGDLTAEIWIAPTLQYLPVRIMIRDGQGHWIDLTLEKPPLQAAAAK